MVGEDWAWLLLLVLLAGRRLVEFVVVDTDCSSFSPEERRNVLDDSVFRWVVIVRRVAVDNR